MKPPVTSLGYERRLVGAWSPTTPHRRPTACLLFTRRKTCGWADDPLGRLRKRLAERRITMELTDAARQHLARVGYDPAYGARPLKRTIQKEIDTVLGRMLLQGKVRDGQTVQVDTTRARG